MYLSLVYHSQSQGCLERFRQIIKSMIKIGSFARASDWNVNMQFLFLAAHEALQELLGYSSFELLLR